MLNELVTWVLKTYLGKYLDDFNPSKLSVALLSGQVELENVPIRKDALRSFGVPIQARAGSIGKIKLRVPVRQFRTAAWCIEIEHVYAVLGPKDIQDLDDEKEKISEYEFKLELLDASEAKWRAENGFQLENYYATSYSSWLNYGTNMATDILENLELKINDVHLRYEDPALGCFGGVKITSLTAHTCDSNWVPGSKSQDLSVSFKLFELKDFCIYWDKMAKEDLCDASIAMDLNEKMISLNAANNHRHIMHPLSARAQCKRERCTQAIRSKQRPRLSCEVMIEEAKFSISDTQYKEMTKSVSELHKLNKTLANRLKRPTCKISQNPSLWWKYAAQCHGFQHANADQKWQTLRENLRYIKIYKRLLLNPNENISKEEKEFKLYFEKSRSLIVLQILRHICWSNAYITNVQFKSYNQQAKSMLFHWFPNWRGWYKNTDTANANFPQLDASENVENDILNALEDSFDSDSSLFSTRDAVLACFTFSLNEGKFVINADDSISGTTIPMFEMAFQQLSTLIEVNPRISTYLIGLSLGSVALRDMLTHGTAFPFLIKPHIVDQERLKHERTTFKRNFLKSKETEEPEPWFQLQYEKRPAQFHSNFILAVKSQSLDIFYNSSACEWLASFFIKPLKGLDFFVSSTTQSSSKFTFLKNWRSALMAEKEHQDIWSFEIDISAPSIIFAKNHLDDSTNVVVVDFGRFRLHKNELKQKEATDTKYCDKKPETYHEEDLFMTPCSTPPGSEISESESPTLCQESSNVSKLPVNDHADFESAFFTKIYDKYFINFTDLQVLICSNQDRCTSASKHSSKFYLLDKFDISLKIQQRIINTMDPEYPLLTLHATLQKLTAHINEKKISDCLDILYPITLDNLLLKRTSVNSRIDDQNEQPNTKENYNCDDIIIQFIIGQMSLEVQSYNRSLVELQIIGACAGLEKKSDGTHMSMSVHGVLLVDAFQSFGSDFELLLASHRQVGVDSKSGRLKQSETFADDSFKKGEEKLQASENLFDYWLQETELEPHLDDMNALINIDIYLKRNDLNDDSPLQTVNIAFNNLDVIANQQTIIELLGFMKRIIFTFEKLYTGNLESSIDKLDDVTKDKTVLPTNLRAELNFNFKRLNILVIRTIEKSKVFLARKVGTLAMTEAKIQASISKDVHVKGSLGGIQIIDITSEGPSHQCIFSVGKDSLTNSVDLQHTKDCLHTGGTTDNQFDATTENKCHDQPDALVFEIYGGKSSIVNLKIRMASVYYTHCPQFINEINMCASQFKTYLKNFATSLRTKATDVAIGLVQHIQDTQFDKSNFFEKDNPRISIDIIFSSPVVVLPRSNESSEVLIANLGQITVYNNLEIDEHVASSGFGSSSEDHVLWTKNNYFVDIRNVSIYSMKKRPEFKLASLLKENETEAHKVHASTILHDTAIFFKFIQDTKKVQRERKCTRTNTLTIQGIVTQLLQVSLSRRQYEQLIDTFDYAAQLNFDIDMPDDGDSVELVNDSNTNFSSNKDNNIETKICFSVPILKLNLKNEHYSSLISITFRDFNIQCDDGKIEKRFHIVLKAVKMEDLKLPKSSKLRIMADSSSNSSKTTSKSRNHNFSSSCPNLTNHCYSREPKVYLSIPCQLDVYSQQRELNQRKKDFFKYPTAIGKAANNNTEANSINDNLVVYKSHFQKEEKSINSMIDFNCLNLTIAVDKWFMVLDFFNLISENEPDASKSAEPKNQMPEDAKDLRKEFKIFVRSLNLILVRNNEEFSKVTIASAFFKIWTRKLVSKVEGRLGSLLLNDLTPFGSLYREKFSTTGPEALYFLYERSTAPTTTTASKKSISQMLEKDAILKIEMSSVRYIHTKRFLMELHMYVNELLQLQSPVIRRIRKSDAKKEARLRSSNMGLEIHAASPIVLLPLSYHSNELLVADLGEFTLKNQFRFANDDVKHDVNVEPDELGELLDVMHVDLVNTNIFTAERTAKLEDNLSNEIGESMSFGNFSIRRMGDNLINETCYLKLQIERNVDSEFSHDNPNISVKGTFSKLIGVLNLQQYKLIRGFLNYNLGESIDDIYTDFAANLSQSLQQLSQAKGYKMSDETLVWKVLSIQIHLEDVSIILTEPSTFVNNKQYLACINFIKSSLQVDSYSDGSQDIDLISKEILIMDSRRNQTVFKHILKPTLKGAQNSVQAEVHCRKKPNATKYTILLNNMRVTAILDCLNSLKNFFKEEPYINSSIIPILQGEINRQSSMENVPEEDSGAFEVVLNVTESELVFIEDLDKIDTSAVILKSTTVCSYKPSNNNVPVSVDINHLEVFSCTLGSEDESALSIIDPCTLNLEVRENLFNVLIQKQLNIRLSYNDIKLFTRLVQRIPEQRNASPQKCSSQDPDFDVIAPLIAMGFSQKESLYAMEVNSYKLNDAAIWLSQQKLLKVNKPYLRIDEVVLNAKHVAICIIDDCMDSDVPLLELSLGRLTVHQEVKANQSRSSHLHGSLDAIIGSEYYNRWLSGWEPIIESWECTTQWSYPESKALSNNLFCVDVISKQLLKFNITTSLIELWDIVRRNWTKDYYCWEPVADPCVVNAKQRTPFVPFALQNLTGEPLLFKTVSSQPGGITRTEINQQDLMVNWISVLPDEIRPFDFGLQTKLRHLHSHKLNLHQILVQIHGWDLIGPISIDKVGTFFRYSTPDMQYTKKARIVFDIALIGSAQKLVTVRSALKIVNKLNVRLMLKMELRNFENSGFVTMEPGQKLSMPLRLTDSVVFAKPFSQVADNEKANSQTISTAVSNVYAKDGNYNFCNCRVSWFDCLKESTQNMHTCFGMGKMFHFLVEIRRDKFPSRDLSNLPGHTITFLPPLKVRNMLCCDLVIRIGESIEATIGASKELDVYAVNAHDSFNLSITLDNYKLSGQLKIPMGHNGIVEPKLKLIDTLNRELYLRVSIQSYQGKGMEIFVSAPIWLINRTGLPLVYRQEGANQLASGQFEEHETARVVTPLMFSFSDDEASPSLEIRLGKAYGNNNPWCQSFNIHKDVFYRELKTGNLKGCYTIGIHVCRGRGLYACSTFVKLSPRFELCNQSSKHLQFAQKYDIINNDASSLNIISAPPGCNFPFHWPHSEQEPILCVRMIHGALCHWSKGFPINDIQSLYINVRSSIGEMHFLRLEVILREATYVLLFTDAILLPPPIRIDNYSDILINFWQTRCQPTWRTAVRPQSSLAYVLDDPLGTMSLQIEVPDGNLIEYSLREFNSCLVTYANFIYIAFKKTFKPTTEHGKNIVTEHENKELVLAVKDKRVIISKKNAGDRSQLWLMNSNGQLEHEGSSPPAGHSQQVSKNSAVRMVLDIDKSPNPMDHSTLVVRPPNKQRMSTQTWRFRNGRLMCHANMCVQAQENLIPGTEAVLGRIEIDSRNSIEVPAKQLIEIQKFRPGSGQLEIESKMDGPIHTVQIRDVNLKQDNILLSRDPNWDHSSISTAISFENAIKGLAAQYSVKIDLPKGFGISVITRQPCEELAYITFENIYAEMLLTPFANSFECKVSNVQIDNQLLESSCPVLMHTLTSANEQSPKDAIVLCVKILSSPNKNSIIFEQLSFNLKPCAIYLEERLILKTALFFGYGKTNELDDKMNQNWDLCVFGENAIPQNLRRYYFENLLIGATQIRLSAFTTPKLSPELLAAKKVLGLTLIKFEDAMIEFELFTDKYHFETLDVYLKAVRAHYINQLKLHAASILGSVDFLGNPLGFANDLSEGVSGLIFEGSLKSLVKNVTHGLSNSTAKLTETLSDSLGRVVLDEYDNETRHKILELPANTSGGHLTAGFKGLGFGLLGGVTSIVHYTYVGAQSDGLPGFLSGLGKGLVGTVTKPIIGVLDLASETASAVRESSRGSHKHIPERKRLPRCISGAPGGLLPPYSYRQSKGQQYLYLINRRQFSEKLLSYEPNLCNEKDAKLRLLVSTENIRIFSRTEQDPSIMFECHLSEVLSCHPLTTTVGNSKQTSKPVPSFYIEISTNLPKITRPRIRCQNEETAERAARSINYAKLVFDERELSVISE